MSTAVWALVVSIGSLAVSIVLASIRVYEVVQAKRLHLTLSASLNSELFIGNELTIYNSSAIPVTVCFFRLVWIKRPKPAFLRPRQVAHEYTPLDHDGCSIKINGWGLVIIEFREEDHFSWGKNLNEDIYLELSLLGRSKPISLFVTGPSA